MITEEQIKEAAILIVDDQQPNLMLLSKLLEIDGYQHVYTTLDSRKALALYQEHQVDLLCLDINMPHLDGFEVLDQLKENVDPEMLTVIILTGETDRDTRLKALSHGGNDFLLKPFDQVEVVTRIRNLLSVRLLQNQIINQNKILEEKVKERTQQLVKTQHEILRRLCKASEYRDDDTGFHVTRMSRYCQLVSQASNKCVDYCNMVLEISAMHDIGKIGIPDGILLKPGRLTNEEFDIMKTHTTIGADMLSGGDSELLQMAETIALTHHEKWDGSGYPNRIAGEDIPFEGRIAAIADVFDALTSERPYKKAWSVEDTIEEMKKGRGKHFDPELLDVFCTILPDVVKVKDQYQQNISTSAFPVLVDRM